MSIPNRLPIRTISGFSVRFTNVIAVPLASASGGSLEATGVARVNRGGEESAVHVTIHYELEVAGDDVSGTQRATLSDGSALGSSRKITGKRETAAPAKS